MILSNLNPPSRIAITGARGQLGSQLVTLLGERARGFDVKEMDITSESSVRQMLGDYRPQVLVNAAAYTAVDAAEENPEACHAVNRDAVDLLARLTEERQCCLVQISTDYVFAGSPQRTPFKETDPIAPAGVYAVSKADAEAVTRQNPRHIVVRTCGLYGPTTEGSSTNFVNTMIRLGQAQSRLEVVNDQICCPTYVPELARALIYLFDHRQTGTFHVANVGPISWFELAQKTFRFAGIECEVTPISTAQYNAQAPRPPYSVLDISKYLATGGPSMSSCVDALYSYLQPRNSQPTDACPPISEANCTSPEA